MTLAVETAVAADPGHAVDHQHRRFRQLRVTGPEQVATRTSKKRFPVETVGKISHVAGYPQALHRGKPYHPARREHKPTASGADRGDIPFETPQTDGLYCRP
jgi:hypothetical protein